MNLDWLYDGVNSSVPRNAGKECADYSTLRQKFVETVIVVTLSILAIKWSTKKLKPIGTSASSRTHHSNNLAAGETTATYNNLPNYNNHHNNNTNCNLNNHKTTTTMPTNRSSTCYYNGCVGGDGGKELLLTAMSITFGLELGFKFASRSVIYILNPCHITTIIQIYLLAAKPSKTVTILFRIQMNYLNGPLLAFIFPETDSRTMTMEVTTYWLQHGLMFIIPIYLLRLGGVYNMEEVSDWSWNVISYAICLIYHFVFLTFFSIPTQVNLNHMLCPALKDPFEGPYYRLAACVHQAILCPSLCKIYCILFMPQPTPTSSNSNSNSNISNCNSSSSPSKSLISNNYKSVKNLLTNGGSSSGGGLSSTNNIRGSDNNDNNSSCSGSVNSLYEKVKKLNNLNENGCDISKIE